VGKVIVGKVIFTFVEVDPQKLIMQRLVFWVVVVGVVVVVKPTIVGV
jgi:hypothetical protein